MRIGEIEYDTRGREEWVGRKDGGCRHSVGETGEEAFASITPKSSTCVSIFSPVCAQLVFETLSVASQGIASR